ncbi:hypothetical protein ABT010_13265 [Streptomyces sp. NPDC002668]|uniref:hypothetical protein n=1 Tax=Streptomyces sp. NPDC002668 TaxID=3154422 RepID=UPI003329FD95
MTRRPTAPAGAGKATPEVELRAAAAKLRGLASKATTGICPDWIYSAVRHIARNCNVDCSHDDHQSYEQPEWDRYEDSPYIAAMHPGVGLALAQWLETEAETWAGDEVHSRCSEKACTLEAALAVARQILGDAS